MGKRFVSGALVAVMVAGVVTLSAGIASAANATDEARFVQLINHERTSRGLNALVVKSDLVYVARRKSDQMAAKGTIWHDSSTWNSVSGWTMYGENVGMGPSDINDPVGNLHQAFMNSPEHRQNILYPTFNQVGIGVTIKDNTMYVTEIFVQRKSTSSSQTTTYHHTTTTRRTTTTTTHNTYRPVAAVTHTHAAPAPAPIVAVPQTVDLLVRMVGMDSDHVDPSTGAAAGF